MLSVTQQPPDNVLTGNPVVYKVNSSDTYITAEILPRLEITFTQEIQTGNTFIVSWSDPAGAPQPFLLVFTAVEFPSGNGLEFFDNSVRFYPPGHVLADYVATVADQIRQQNFLSSFYNITTLGTVLTIEAKEPVAETVPAFVDNLTGATIADFIAFQVGVQKANFKLLLELWVEQPDDTYLLVTTLSSPPDRSGETRFEVEGVLHAELETLLPSPPVPPLNTPGTYKPETQRKFYARAGAKENNDFTVDSWVLTTTKLATLGGVSREDFESLDWFTYLPAHPRFMTWWPEERSTGPFQSEYLSWMNYTGADMIPQLYGVVYFQDGTDTGEILLIDANASQIVPQWEILTFSVGFHELALESIDPTKAVQRYEVFVRDGLGALVSDIRKYKVNQYGDEHARKIVYLNSLYVPEVVRTTGDWIEILEPNKQLATRIYNSESSFIDGQAFVFKTNAAKLFSARTGHITKGEAVGMQEMLFAKYTYEMRQQGHFPLLIGGDAHEVTEDNRLLHFYELEIAASVPFLSLSNMIDDTLEGPLVSVIYNCGGEGLAVDPNGFLVADHAPFNIYLPNGQLHETLIWDANLQIYPAQVIFTAPGDWRVVGELILSDGRAVWYDFTFPIVPAFLNYANTKSGIHKIQLTASQPMQVEIDFDDGGGPIIYPVGTSPTIIQTTYPNSSVKNVVAQFACVDLVTELTLGAQEVQMIDPSPLTNLTLLDLSGNNLAGVFDLTTNPLLVTALLQNNALLTVTHSPLASLEVLDISSNVLSGTLDVSTHPALRELTFSDNLFTVLDITGLSTLEILDGSDNEVAGTLDVTGNTDIVKVLMGSNSLTTFTPGSLGSLSDLNISFNLLAGSIDLTDYPGILNCFINNNSYMGMTIGALGDLAVLDYSFNSINGTINHSTAPSLVSISGLENDATRLIFGVLNALNFVDCKNNMIPTNQLRNAVLDLWDNRASYTNPGAITLSGQQGAPDLITQDAAFGTDLSLTGLYLGDGLLQSGWTVTL